MKVSIGNSKGILASGKMWTTLNYIGIELFYPTGRIWNQANPFTWLITSAILTHSTPHKGSSIAISKQENLLVSVSFFFLSFNLSAAVILGFSLLGNLFLKE